MAATVRYANEIKMFALLAGRWKIYLTIFDPDVRVDTSTGAGQLSQL